MSLRAHTVKPKKGSNRKKKRSGRGTGSGKGVYCGRGLKGQRARSGGKSGTLYIGLKDDIMRLPKLGGFNSPNDQQDIVNVGRIEDKFSDGAEVTPWSLKEKGLVSNPKDGVKILAEGEINISVTVSDCDFSSKAKEKIEEAGGEIKQTS